ncbi:MAG TPA: hypothetical protein VFM90_10730, partial [Cyclobacteriaceae bacterium]|nr:hypothetical protein [Cyclobacteriaceae bacterium]
MATNTKIKRIFIKSMKVLGWITVSVLALFILLVILIRLPSVQHKITQRAVIFLKEKIGTEVQLSRAFIAFPKQIVLEGLYVEDQSADTLAYIGKLVVNANLWALTKNSVEVSSVSIEHFTSNIKRTAADSAFNFTYILRAFVGDTTQTPADTTSRPWTFKIEDIALQKISLMYDDRLTGNSADVTLGKLTLPVRAFDPAKAIYKAGKIKIENVRAVIEQSKATPATPQAGDSVSGLPVIEVEEIDLRKIALTYSHLVKQQYLNADLKQVYIDMNSMDLQKNFLDIDNIELKHSFITYNFYQPEAARVQQPQKNPEPFTGLNIPWTIAVDDINLEDNSIQYFNSALPVQKGTVDFHHLWLFGLQCQVNDVHVAGNTVRAEIESFSFQEKSNFSLHMLEADFKLDEKNLHIGKLRVESGHSKIELAGNATFNSLTDYHTARVDIEIPRSTVAAKDVLFFAPHLLANVPVKLPRETTITFASKISGTFNNLTLNNLTAQTLSNTSLAVQGNIKNISDPDNLTVRVSLDKFYTTSTDVRAV